jgi:hypothetical protein
LLLFEQNKTPVRKLKLEQSQVLTLRLQGRKNKPKKERKTRLGGVRLRMKGNNELEKRTMLTMILKSKRVLSLSLYLTGSQKPRNGGRDKRKGRLNKKRRNRLALRPLQARKHQNKRLRLRLWLR